MATALLHLRIENLALIRSAELELEPGLNAVTGETGAGKTVLAQAIGLLTGAQPPVSAIGPHGDEAYVEAEFAVDDALFAEPELAGLVELRPDGETTLIAARRLTRAGRSRALLWGRACARADLELVVGRLLEISSQHEARRLARPGYGRDLLDAHAALDGQLAEMRRRFAAAREAEAALEAAREQAAAAARRRGELEDLADRVEAAAVAPGERESLLAERERLRHVDDLLLASAGAAEQLSPADGVGAIGACGRAADLVGAAARIDASLQPAAAELLDAAERMQEAVIALRGYVEELDSEPGRLDAVEARLEAFAQLERRYGAPLPDVLEMAREARASLADAQGAEDRLARLAAAATEARADAERQAGALSRARAKAADAFARAVEAELGDLGMQGARFEVVLREAPMGPAGRDRAELLLTANAGLGPAPLASTASGGELSRIALAVRVAARRGRRSAASADAPVLVLDEIDAGVGGFTARAVADKLRELAQSSQLICITHLAPIAGQADAHFLVSKQPGRAGAAAATTVERLQGQATVRELARMLGGSPNDALARRHAASLRG
jgi:DNA repair protein RecN (Recombination protein N)